MTNPKQYEKKHIFLLVDTINGSKQYVGYCKEVTFLGKDTKGDEVYNYLIIEDKTDKMFCFTTNQIKYMGFWIKRV